MRNDTHFSARPDGGDVTGYRYAKSFSVWLRDLDPQDHVNNAVYATYLEQTRVEYVRDVVGDARSEAGMVIVTLHLEYEAPLGMDDPVTVEVRVPSIGGRSFEMEYRVRSGDTVAATGQTTQVTLDPETGDACRVPDGWRERIAEFEGL